MNDASTPPKPDIHRVLDLQKLVNVLGTVDRMVYIPPSLETAETDVQHSFSLAMLCWFLAPHFPHLNAGRLVQLCMAHDIMEAYCGDTFSFDDHAVTGQQEREIAAIAQLEKEWADFPDLIDALHEFEAGETSESKFVQTLDRLQPVLMDYLSEGRTWHKLGITFDKLVAIKEKDAKMATSPEIAEYYAQLKDILIKNPQLFPGA